MLLYILQRLLQTLLHVFGSDEYGLSNRIRGSVIYGRLASETFENKVSWLLFDSLCTTNAIVRLCRAMSVHKTRHIFNFFFVFTPVFLLQSIWALKCTQNHIGFFENFFFAHNDWMTSFEKWQNPVMFAVHLKRVCKHEIVKTVSSLWKVTIQNHNKYR